MATRIQVIAPIRLTAFALLLLGAAPDAHSCADGAASPSVCLLSQVGCEELPAFLESHLPVFPVTLIVDIQCEVSEPLVIPGRMTLAGVGRDGNGELLFPALAPSEAALSIPAGRGHVQIRDLTLRGLAEAPTATGIRLHQNSQVSIESTRVDGFEIGIHGTQSLSVLIRNSNVSANGINLLLGEQANTWRIRDTIVSQARTWGILVRGPNNDVVIEGSRLESNTAGAIRAYSYGAIIESNRFERNGSQQHRAIVVESSAQSTRILSNYFSSDYISNYGSATQCAFNLNTPEPASCAKRCR